MLDDLIERLKGATEGSGGLDGLVWEATGHCAHRIVKRYAVQSDTGFTCDACGIEMFGVKIPKLTTDLNAALALVEEKLASLDIYLTKHRKEGCGAELVYVRNRLPRSARSEGQATLPLALLIALLTALKEQNNG